MEIGGISSLWSTAETAGTRRAEAGLQNLAGRLLGEGELEKLHAAAKEFEAMFLQQLFDVMRRSVPQGSLFERSFARETYEGMFYEELAKISAKSGGIGLADMIMEQLGRDVYDPKRPG